MDPRSEFSSKIEPGRRGKVRACGEKLRGDGSGIRLYLKKCPRRGTKSMK